MVARIGKGANLLSAHRKYIYQLLAKEKQIAHWKVSMGYGLLQAVVGLSVLAIKPLGLMPVILVVGAYSIGFFVLVLSFEEAAEFAGGGRRKWILPIISRRFTRRLGGGLSWESWQVPINAIFAIKGRSSKSQQRLGR